MSESKEIATRRDMTPAEAGDMPGLIRFALETGTPPENMEKLFGLFERIAARDARAAFVAAMHRFQSQVGPVPKVGKVQVAKAGVMEVRSTFAPLPVIAEHIRKPLADNGLYYRWTSEVAGDIVHVHCHVSHIDGHEETSTFSFPWKDAAAPGMSGVQIGGSARTYGERYSLVQALGLTTADEDNDGKAPGRVEEEAGPITEEQLADLRAVMTGVGMDEARFARWLAVEKLADLPSDELAKAFRALELKRREGA